MPMRLDARKRDGFCARVPRRPAPPQHLSRRRRADAVRRGGVQRRDFLYRCALRSRLSADGFVAPGPSTPCQPRVQRVPVTNARSGRPPVAAAVSLVPRRSAGEDQRHRDGGSNGLPPAGRTADRIPAISQDGAGSPAAARAVSVGRRRLVRIGQDDARPAPGAGSRHGARCGHRSERCDSQDAVWCLANDAPWT